MMSGLREKNVSNDGGVESGNLRGRDQTEPFLVSIKELATSNVANSRDRNSAPATFPSFRVSPAGGNIESSSLRRRDQTEPLLEGSEESASRNLANSRDRNSAPCATFPSFRVSPAGGNIESGSLRRRDQMEPLLEGSEELASRNVANSRDRNSAPCATFPSFRVSPASGNIESGSLRRRDQMEPLLEGSEELASRNVANSRDRNSAPCATFPSFRVSPAGGNIESGSLRRRDQMEPLLVGSEELTAVKRDNGGADGSASAISSCKVSSTEVRQDGVSCEELMLVSRDVCGNGGASSAVSSLRGQDGASCVDHPSPTHTAELMRSGGLPKNRRRPGTVSDSQRVTMTGTVTRGSSVGQPVEVQLELTETERLQLTSQQSQTKGDHKLRCDRTHGPHIILWSVLCIPVAMAISISISFYNGSLTWYNLIIYFSEERTFFHKVALCPLIILSFPVTVGVSCFCISLLASAIQISWSWSRWRVEIRDGEKGFYGWFCGKVRLPRCSPYQVVVLECSRA